MSVLKTKAALNLKELKRTYKKNSDFGLEIVTESNLRIVNYLYVILNLNDGLFRPYHKLDDIVQYSLTKNLTTVLILLSTCPHLLKNHFQTILTMKKYLK